MWVQQDDWDIKTLFKNNSWDYNESLDSFPHIYVNTLTYVQCFIFSNNFISIKDINLSWERINANEFNDRQEQANALQMDIKQHFCGNIVFLVTRNGPIWSQPASLILFEEDVK